MKKIDFKKTLKELYAPSAKTPAIVKIPKMNYLMIDGKGDPNTSKEFSDAISALYPLAYTLKFKIKKSKAAVDYGVMPLEGLWWADDMSSFTVGAKQNWKWTLMIMQPDFITKALFKEALGEVSKKKDIPALKKIRFESLDEKKCGQIMHIGPFSAEGPTIKKLHEFIASEGYKLRGKHHEIYLSDMRKTNPAKLKTVLRQPAA